MKYLALFVLSWLPLTSLNAETLTIATFPIPLMVESKDKGVFIELTKAVAKEAGYELKIQVYPPPRTLKEFAAKKVDGIFPALKVTMPVAYERSESVYVKRDYAFTVKGKPALQTLGELAGKRVAITSGYPYAEVLTSQEDIRFETANSDEQNVKKLLAGRVNAFVVEEKSGLTAFSKDGSRDKISYNAGKPLSEQDVFYAFQQSNSGKVRSDRISQALKTLKDNGTFARIMAKAK